jgi:hypothetical protein
MIKQADFSFHWIVSVNIYNVGRRLKIASDIESPGLTGRSNGECL